MGPSPLSMRSDERKLAFFGVSAYVGRIDSETRCGFWPDDPHAFNFDPGRLVSVDLALTPANAAEGKIRWDQVIIEDHGITTIGPGWPRPDVRPSFYQGAVYLEEEFLTSLRRMHHLPVPPDDSRAGPYEYQTVVHFDGERKGLRYRGFHVEVTHIAGHHAKLMVYAPGTAGTKAPLGPFELDLESEDLDPIGEVASPQGPTSGSVFVSTGWLSRLPGAPLEGPKLPIGEGLLMAGRKSR